MYLIWTDLTYTTEGLLGVAARNEEIMKRKHEQYK
jgi:hypothetical protein